MLIIANGMVRSGSTLQYNLASRILETSPGFEKAGFIGSLDEAEHREAAARFKTNDKTALIKSHSLPIEAAFYDDNVRVLFCYRDFRDIAASIKKKWGWSFDVITQRLDDLIVLEAEIMGLPNVLSQSYETLFDDMESAIVDLAKFLDVDLGAADIKAIKGELSVDSVKSNIGMSLKDKIKHKLTRKVDIDGHTLFHKNHISKTNGANGDWNNQFTAEEITILSTRYHDWLTQHSYA